MKYNGEPERWLVAARLSYVTRKDRERGDAMISGIQTQDEQAAKWAEAEGHQIVHVTKDRNVSGAVPPWERPELGPWLTEPEKLIQYDGIVAFDVTRLSREYFDLGWLRHWAEAAGKKLYVIKDRLTWPDHRDGMLWAVAGERAHQERLDLIERVTRQLEALRAAGKLVGRPPFGYDSEGDKGDRRLMPTEAGRVYVPEIYRRSIAGQSQETIAAWLTAEGVKPVSGKWWGRTIGGLIKNPVYKGHRCERIPVPADEVEKRDGRVLRYRYGDKWVEYARQQYGKTIHRCEPLVDAVTWRQANEALRDRPKRGHSDPANRAMLAEALHCPDCDDSPMYRHRALSRGRAYFYYRCFGRGQQRRSCGNMVPVGKVDDAADAIIRRDFNVPEMETVVKRGNEAAIDNRLEEIQTEINQLGYRGLPDDEYDAELARLRAERDAVRNTDLIADSVEARPTGNTYAGLWEATPVSERGPWLARHGFRVYASKAEVVVEQGGKLARRKL